MRSPEKKEKVSKNRLSWLTWAGWQKSEQKDVGATQLHMSYHELVALLTALAIEARSIKGGEVKLALSEDILRDWDEQAVEYFCKEMDKL